MSVVSCFHKFFQTISQNLSKQITQISKSKHVRLRFHRLRKLKNKVWQILRFYNFFQIQNCILGLLLCSFFQIQVMGNFFFLITFYFLFGLKNDEDSELPSSKATPPPRSSSKRSRAAEFHNLSEKVQYFLPFKKIIFNFFCFLFSDFEF